MVLHIWSENWRQLVNISVLVGQFSYKSILFSMYNLFMWINHVCYLETTIQSLFFFLLLTISVYQQNMTSHSGHECSGSFPFSYLLWMWVSAECLESKDTKTVQQAYPFGAKQTNESKLSKEQGFFFSLVCPISAMFSPHQNPLAIVQQHTASLHMFSDCSITLLLPPAHFFNRPFWLACYIKMISAVISFSLPQHCKTVLSTAQSAAVWNMIAKH